MRATILLLTLLAIPSFPDDAKPAPKLADAAWLTGGWKSDPAEKMAMEELWQGPVNGSMCGTFRMCSPGRPALYEFLLLEEQADGAWMRLRHYGPEMADKDEKPVKLKMAEASDRRLLFTNPDGSKPKRVVYERDGKEGLVVVVETERDGKPAKLTIKFARAGSK
jgi:hypothetical protein